MTKITNGANQWSKFYFGNHYLSLTSSELDTVVKVPFVGLSRSRTAGDTSIHTTFVAMSIKMTITEWIAILDAATGDFLSIQSVGSQPAGSQYLQMLGNNFLFQTLSDA